MNRLLMVTLAAAMLLMIANLAAPQSPGIGGKRGMELPIDPQLLNNLPEIKGIVSWRLLGQVKQAQVGQRFVPEFDAEVRKLDQKDVKLQGYMMPITAGEKHNHFLLTMRPADCAFCLSVGPEYIVEVKAKTSIKHTYEPVVVAGRLNVLRDDPFGLYYRLTDAQLSSAVK
ncbi:MAG: DUF3299 domain-containing protein [Burkholderiaceae bacterium]|nr:DUF3299 domain-containing protein [Burkholderiaceae bacterium]